jgi:hypothetical protein
VVAVAEDMLLTDFHQELEVQAVVMVMTQMELTAQ